MPKIGQGEFRSDSVLIKGPLTDIELASIHSVLLLCGGVGPGKGQGVHDTLSGALLRKLHLIDGILDIKAFDLVGEKAQLLRAGLEVGSRKLVLKYWLKKRNEGRGLESDLEQLAAP